MLHSPSLLQKATRLQKTALCLSLQWYTKMTNVFLLGRTQTRADGNDGTPHLLVAVLFMQPRIPLAFLTASVSAWMLEVHPALEYKAFTELPV